jgi:hypothetical protein
MKEKYTYVVLLIDGVVDFCRHRVSLYSHSYFLSQINVSNIEEGTGMRMLIF